MASLRGYLGISINTGREHPTSPANGTRERHQGMADDTTYDYVIVGAGTAGCTLANRLSEDQDVRVLVLEAGGWDRHPWIRLPLTWHKILERRMYDWMYFTEPEPNLDGRRIECARAKVIGGCSSTNALAYIRGNPGDYDRWAGTGLTQWSYAHVLPYFRRQETWTGEASVYRGENGPLTTSATRYDDRLIDAYTAAAVAAGHQVTDDFNGAKTEGFGRPQTTIVNGRRRSVADAYLRPALARRNLAVAVKAFATRIVLEGKRAVGVEFAKDGRRTLVHAKREVILAAGSINSPHLLMLSGIGDPAELRPHSIDVKSPLAGVGKNLADHLGVSVSYSRTEPGPFHRLMRVDRITAELAKAYLFGSRNATTFPLGSMAFVRTRSDKVVPDIFVIFRAVPAKPRPYLPPFKNAYTDGFGAFAVLQRPESSGSIKLASSDPNRAVRIHQNFLATEGDRKTMRNGIRLLRDIGAQTPIRSYIGEETSPGADKTSDKDLDAYIRKTATTTHHPIGTCKMGTDADTMAVVDADLRVRGVDALRVVDASVMPDAVGGGQHAAVVMIAEKASDLIRGRKPLPPLYL
jgi:4-pyridoxate dehydrogenase